MIIPSLKRNETHVIEEWLSLPIRSPLVIFGPRQTGKTTLAKEFAAKHFPERTISVNFYKDVRDSTERKKFAQIFEQSQDPTKVLENISVIIKRQVDPKRDLLILDEVQDCKPAYEILKNFKDDYPEFPIIASGSYLGLFLETEKEIRHPVGATRELNIGPLSFSEFLCNYNPPLYTTYQNISLGQAVIDPVLHEAFIEALNTYLFTGGMPEAVALFLATYKENLELGLRSTREKQIDLLTQYSRDMDKYAKTTDIKKLRKIFESVPIYLERFHEDSVDRIRFSQIEEHANYRLLKTSFDYLRYNGLTIESHIVNNPQFPLTIQKRENEAHQFKAFFFDIGLLNCTLDCPYQQLFNRDMGHYKGYIVENFVAQILKKHTHQKNLFTYRRSAREQAAEIEFLITLNGQIVPLEVKSSAKSSRSKSLRSYIERYAPQKAFKCSLKPTLDGGKDFIQVPLYLVEKIFSAA